MHLPGLIQLSSAAASPELVAGIKSATPGTSFALDLGDGRGVALLTFTALQAKAGRLGGVTPIQDGVRYSPPLSGISAREKKRLRREAFFAEITNRLQSGQARSVHAAALQLADQLETGGTRENQANYLGKQYRKQFCLPASAFSQNQTNNSKDVAPAQYDNGASEFENQKENRMPQTDNALAPGVLQRIIPRHFLIDLRAEGLGDATTEEILSPDFWADAKPILKHADIVSLIRGDASVLNVYIMLFPDGSVQVADLAATGHHVPPHPDLAAKLAAHSEAA